MAHEIESMIYAGATPWHGLGTQVSDAISTSEAIEKAGLNWTVSLKPLQLADGRKVQANAAIRDSDSKVLGVVGPTWKPLQNHEAFAWFDPILANGEARLETAMSLRGGERIAILARIVGDPLVIVPKADDRVEQFILLSNGHDGRLAVRCGFTPVRVVCANTLAMAHEDKQSKLLRLLHRGNIVGTLDTVRDAMNVARAQFEATADQFRYLASRNISIADLKKYVQRVFRQRINVVDAQDAQLVAPEPELLEEPKGIFGKIVPLFEHGRGNDLPGVKGTWWGAYNAVSEFLSHERGADQAIRVNSVLLGQGAHTNRRALDVAIEMAA